jgi:hypothetical protein
LKNILVIWFELIIKICVLFSFDDGAEQSCEEAIRLALDIDPDSLDGLQALANVRLSQSRKDDAVATMKVVYEKLMSLREKLRARTVLEELGQTHGQEEILEDLLGA